MATDLFGQYFNNPTKSYIYTNMTCNGPSADEISFDIVGGNGVISDNENDLAKIDLSEVHVGLTQYTNDMKVINPYEFVYVKGISHGESYTTKAYGVVVDKVLNIEDWMYKTTLIFHIKYINSKGNKVLQCIKASGSELNEQTFIEACQEIFDSAKIPINIEYKDRYIYFSSTQLGYDFWIAVLELWHYTGEGDMIEKFPEIFKQEENESNKLGFGFDDDWAQAVGAGSGALGTNNAYTGILDESTYRSIYDILSQTNGISTLDSDDLDFYTVDTDELFNTYLFEDLTKYVSAHKYRNGAMKGFVIVATYPIFNANSIQDTQKSLLIGHLVDRVEEYYTTVDNHYSGVPVYVRVVRDVVDSYYSQYEYDAYNKWSNSYTHINYFDNWIDPEEIPFLRNKTSEWDHSHVPNYYMMNSLYKDVSHYDAIGLYGYANYLTNHNGWISMGQFYARTAVADDMSETTYNLIPSFLIYNPNSFPVTIKYMTFV